LYNGHKSSPYWYTGGFNLRTFGAWLIAAVSVIHGLAGNFNTHYDKGSTNIYSIGMLMSFAIAGPLYYIFNRIWPVDIYPVEHADAPKTREYMGKTDGMFEDEIIVGVETRSSTEEQVVVDKSSKMV
jgi:NCS1 family nucleobase:cation symporter-1